MNQMEIFKNPEFGRIRVIEENGKYLFCGTDVAAALGYSNPRDAIIRHCRYVVKRDAPHPQSPDRKISMTFIPEGDLYRLIVHSKLPSAERFEQWVFDEVLPTIRKHGAYLTKEKLWEVATSPEALMKLCSDLLAEREANISLRIQFYESSEPTDVIIVDWHSSNKINSIYMLYKNQYSGLDKSSILDLVSADVIEEDYYYKDERFSIAPSILTKQYCAIIEHEVNEIIQLLNLPSKPQKHLMWRKMKE